MCGIVGRFEPGRDARDHLAAVEEAVSVMHHRGPDDRFADSIDGLGSWGMCRLAIRDPAQGRQPFWRKDVGVVFNGEIYNTDDLRRLLERRGHEFETRCDTEVLLAAYLEFGTAAFGLLDGIFAAAVVDRRTNRLALARDEFGVKPLFVRDVRGSVTFASEPKALRALGVLGDGVEHTAVTAYLRYQYVPEPLSPWRNVRRIPCGTVEVFDTTTLERVAVETFQQPAPAGADICPDDWADATAEAVYTSVRRQLISDRPLGVFLSGGIDSTLVSAVASELHPGIRAFGISVPGTHRDERPYMEEAARHLDVDLTVTDLRESDFDRLFDQLLDVYDEPFGDFSAVPTMLVSEVAASDLRVVLSGDGGDELFAGYGRYRFAHAAGVAERLPPVVGRLARRLPSRVGRRPAAVLGRVSDEVALGGHGYNAFLAVNPRERLVDLLGDHGSDLTTLAPADRHPAPWSRDECLDTAMDVDIAQYLPADILTKVDRATMAVSLEARVPLLGAPVARLAARMPAAVKVRDDVPKWPLKELLRRRGFSESFLHRKKMGFSFPIDDWLRAALERRPELVELMRDPPPPLRREASGQLLDRLLAGDSVGHPVWLVLVLSGWLRRNA